MAKSSLHVSWKDVWTGIACQEPPTCECVIGRALEEGRGVAHHLTISPWAFALVLSSVCKTLLVRYGRKEMSASHQANLTSIVCPLYCATEL